MDLNSRIAFLKNCYEGLTEKLKRLQQEARGLMDERLRLEGAITELSDLRLKEENDAPKQLDRPESSEPAAT